MKRILLAVSTMVMTAAATTIAFADVPVIANNGGTVSSTPYLSLINVDVNQVISSIPQSQILSLAQPPTSINTEMMPVATPAMSPGKVETHAIDAPLLPNPLFVIGSDSLSIAWLAANKTKLQQLHAVGMLVQANGPDDLSNMQNLAKPLLLLPISGNAIAAELHVTHYPILVTQTQVEQ